MRTIRRIGFVVCTLCAWAAAVQVGFADFIGDTDGNSVIATAGSTHDPNETTYQAYHLTDGNGMAPNDPVAKSSTATGDWKYNSGTMWMSEEAPGASDKQVLFTFATPASLDEIVIWNYNQNAESVAPDSHLWGRGLKDVVITYSTGSDISGTTAGILFEGQLTCATGSASQAYTNDIAVTAADVKAVKIAYTTNWNGGSYYGLSEVRFGGTTTTTPEPGALALLATAIVGLSAYAWRKRKS
jgi:hypothetical protein